MYVFISPRHDAQPTTADSYVKHHWGYLDETLPCTGTPALCEYLYYVYSINQLSNLYSFIMWAVIGGILLIFVGVRLLKPRHRTGEAKSAPSVFYRLFAGAGAACRRWLLPESFTGFFGNVSRLQILILAILLAYLLIFTMVGEVYQSWYTPVKNTTRYSHRTGLGPLSDRIGVLAYALTPLTVLLSSRESILTLVTAIPYQNFNFLHRWVGRIIFVQAMIHTIGWTVVEAYLYQPQPTLYTEFLKNKYIIWGCIATALICFLFVFSLPPVIKLTGHEFFRKSHYVVACLYFGACWGHWQQLVCWMIASLGIFALDRGVRLLRTLLLHIGYIDANNGFGFHAAQSSIQYFDDEHGGCIRLDFDHNSDPWAEGQHYFLTFPTLSIWQSHPFTVGSIPTGPKPHHTYIIRCRKGETGNLKKLALESIEKATTSVILSGPYGKPLLQDTEITNILAIAGGTGITLTLPVILTATSGSIPVAAAIDFVWIIRQSSDTEWIASELAQLRSRARNATLNLNIHIYVTQDDHRESQDGLNTTAVEKFVEISTVPADASSGSSASLDEKNCSNSTTYSTTSVRPVLSEIVNQFMEHRAISSYRTRVIASGPASMGHDLRTAVATVNDGGKVWRGDNRWNVSLDWDDRMG